MKRKLILISGFLMCTCLANAASYDYSIDMTDSEGNVQHMGDMQVNIYQEGDSRSQTSNGTEDNSKNAMLLHKIQSAIKSSYKEYNINIHLREGVVTLQGVVRSDNDKMNIENEVLKIEGIKKVNNQLQVGSLKTPTGN